MLDFIVTGLPRSGTTWIANWLTTDQTLCIHDPLYKYTLDELNGIITSKKLGVSCTALWRFPDYLKDHQARKLIVHRDLKEVNDSLANEMQVDTVSEEDAASLKDIFGIHADFKDIFDKDRAKEIYETLLQLPFDEERYLQLVEMNIQPNFGKVTFDLDKLKDFRRRIEYDAE